MTRWKREFRAWAKAENLYAWYMPKDPAEWATAKAASRVIDSIARRPEVQQAMEQNFLDAIIYGTATTKGGLADLVAPRTLHI